MRESKTLELKLQFSSSFLKTVSAFANCGTGSIIFGIDDNGQVIGIENIDATCLQIKNSISDNIEPKPEYRIEIDNEAKTISLIVDEGEDKPYFYKSKAYVRKDASTCEADRLELMRLILAGKNQSFDSSQACNSDLSFATLESYFQKQVGVLKLNREILLTLWLINQAGKYTVAAELLADHNMYPGIDMVKFGQDTNVFLDRNSYEHYSILAQYESAIQKFRQYYIYEEIQGFQRYKHERIPESAFREAIANALVHRTWDVDAPIKVAMFDNYLEITSPGGLPAGLSEDEFLHANISILRNPILADVLLKLRIIERFGTGIHRIFQTYEKSYIKPTFTISSNIIQLRLPVLQINHPELTIDENSLLAAIAINGSSSSDLVNASHLGKTKVINMLNKLIKEGYVYKDGKGRSTRYHRQKD